MDEALPSDFTGPKQMEGLHKNLAEGQLVLVGDAEDLSHRGAYCLGRIHCLHPQTRKGEEIVQRATVALMVKLH